MTTQTTPTNTSEILNAERKDVPAIVKLQTENAQLKQQIADRGDELQLKDRHILVLCEELARKMERNNAS